MTVSHHTSSVFVKEKICYSKNEVSYAFFVRQPFCIVVVCKQDQQRRFTLLIKQGHGRFEQVSPTLRESVAGQSPFRHLVDPIQPTSRLRFVSSISYFWFDDHGHTTVLRGITSLPSPYAWLKSIMRIFIWKSTLRRKETESKSCNVQYQHSVIFLIK